MNNIKVSFPILFSERVELRPISEKDAPQILFLRSDDTVCKFIERPKMDSLIEAKQFINERIKDINNHKINYWGISLKGKGKLIGTICLWNFSKNKSVAEIGYDLSPKYFNRGLMSESIKTVIDFGFNTLKLLSIEAYTHSGNINSIKLLKKIDFIFQLNRKDDGFPHNKIFVLKNPN